MGRWRVRLVFDFESWREVMVGVCVGVLRMLYNGKGDERVLSNAKITECLWIMYCISGFKCVCLRNARL